MKRLTNYVLAKDEKTYTPAGVGSINFSWNRVSRLKTGDSSRSNLRDKPRCPRHCISQCTLPDESHVETSLARKKVVFLSSSEHSFCIAVRRQCRFFVTWKLLLIKLNISLQSYYGFESVLPPFSPLATATLIGRLWSFAFGKLLFSERLFFLSNDRKTEFEFETKIVQNVPVIMVQTGKRWFYFE